MVEQMGYDIQAASYLHITGASHFVFCVAEREAPFLSAEYELGRDDTTGKDYLVGGFKKYRALLNRYAECVRTNEWPGYGPAKVLAPSRWYKEAA